MTMQHLQPNVTLQGGKYRVDRLLAQGGFGNTYVGYNTEFKETVAIKEFFMKGVSEREQTTNAISVSNAENVEQFKEQREKFKKEARRLRQLNNPHIVKVHDLFEENGTAYYVMDYIDGENLNDRLKRTKKPMSEAEVDAILSQILDALKAVHDTSIWHFDLKPANIMIDKQGQVKLIDFGASKQLDAQKGGSTNSTAICYTNGYAPREQMEQNYDKCGPWTDLYALGATLYTLLTNKRPPLPSDIDDDPTTDKHIALPFPSTVSQNMKRCVLWMMKGNWMQRPQSVDEVVKKRKEWARIERSDSQTGIPPKKQTNKWIWIGAGTAVAGVFAIIGIVALVVLYKTVLSDSDLFSFGKPDALELYQKGECYFYGDGVEQDYYQAVEWYEKAAEQGLDSAQYSLGYCYYNGIGATQDYYAAVEWYQKAAEQGYAAAQNNLGVCYKYGQGVLLNYYEATRWFRKAAEQGHAVAQNNLGESYYNGHGVSQDYYEAAEWYLKAAEQGNATAQNNLGECYYFGHGTNQNYTEAVKWYIEAAKQGNVGAQYSLGYCYEYGHGIRQNYDEAAEWYLEAAEQGHASAQNNLGECYYYGHGVSMSYAEAAKWYRKAAEQGNAPAQYNIGYCYEQGLGVMEDKNKAIEWYQKAADQGNESAISRLQFLRDY